MRSIRADEMKRSAMVRWIANRFPLAALWGPRASWHTHGWPRPLESGQFLVKKWHLNFNTCYTSFCSSWHEKNTDIVFFHIWCKLTEIWHVKVWKKWTFEKKISFFMQYWYHWIRLIEFYKNICVLHIL